MKMVQSEVLNLGDNGYSEGIQQDIEQIVECKDKMRGGSRDK